MSRMVGAVTVAALSTGAIASAASAASLKVTVPSQVKKGADYTIRVQGSYEPSELTGKCLSDLDHPVQPEAVPGHCPEGEPHRAVPAVLPRA
jgi:hypothetical protein